MKLTVMPASMPGTNASPKSPVGAEIANLGPSWKPRASALAAIAREAIATATIIERTGTPRRRWWRHPGGGVRRDRPSRDGVRPTTGSRGRPVYGAKPRVEWQVDTRPITRPGVIATLAHLDDLRHFRRRFVRRHRDDAAAADRHDRDGQRVVTTEEKEVFGFERDDRVRGIGPARF